VVSLEGIVKNMKYYNKTNTCDICGIDFKEIGRYPLRQYNKTGDWTGKWLCNKCYKRDEYKERYICYRRTGNLDPNCASAKGDKFEGLTHRWKGVKILSEENDNYTGPLDHSVDFEGKIPQTKGKFYDARNRVWAQTFTGEYNAIIRGFEFDYLIFYCASKDGKIIERIYIIPSWEIIKRKSIGVSKNPTDSHGNPIIPWYDEYRVKDEETIKKVNEIWKTIIN